ncbi:MAG TPA: M60 family metallopeptidase [Anaerolineae bacterium]|nr:M60 family metallopeptidase [Anaerolineae bacterium]
MPRRSAFPALSFLHRTVVALVTAVLLLGLPHRTGAQAPGNTIPADFKALTNNLDAMGCGGTPGTVAVFGTGSFPLVMDGDGRRAIVAAGRSAVGGRALAAAHTSWEGPADGKRQLWENVTAWAGRKPRPVLAFSPGHPAKAALQSAGFTVKDFRPDTADSDALKGVDLLFLNMHVSFSAAGSQAVHLFTQQGGGLALTATPWALSAANFRLAQDWLDPYGLAFTGEYATCGQLRALSDTPSPYRSALLAIEALIDDHAGRRALSLEDKRTCAETILQVLGVRGDLSGLNERLAVLSAAYGPIQVGPSMPLNRADKPVEAMLARYQFNHWQAAPPEERAAHPSAADWPGLPLAGETLEGLVQVDASASADRLMNHGGAGTRVNTGLYALPGRSVIVTVPPEAAGKGLAVEIGIHVDANWHHDVWRRFPDIMRRDPLSAPRTVTANPFGGLVSIIVPPGAALGRIAVNIDGAVAAPHFSLGKDDAADWDRLKALPGAWGYIESPLMSVYVSRRALQGLTDAAAVARHWQTAVELADRTMGYTQGRRRGEAAITDAQISVGYGHAGFPFMMEYGDSAVLVDDVVRQGDWGYYHELGHSYQDDFDGAYTIATHAEVDVNLVPGILMNLVHHRFPNDNDIHGTLDADSRLAARAAFAALPAAQQTWDKACGSAMAYDFYFNLAEAFGWDLYGRALGRIYRSVDRPGSDQELGALDAADPNFKRNRFFLAFSLEAGRNLGAYFARYGLGKGDFGISAAVLDQVKGLPVWTDSRPVTGLSDPGTLTVNEDVDPDKPLFTFSAQDPDPGTIFLYEISAGNVDGAFAMDRVSGKLRAVDLDFDRARSYQLTVTVHDNAVPWTAKAVRFAVDVVNVEPTATPALPTVPPPSATAEATKPTVGRLWLPLLER